MPKAIWAEPRTITDIDDCYFYHTMDIPNHGLVRGEWDLRGRESEYLGHTRLAGKRVLEIGTASGHLCFSMEQMGASVVAYDLSEHQDWDIVPYAGHDFRQHIAERRAHIRKLNNGFWFTHRARGSAARVVYGSVYEIPDDIGEFDVCTFGSILLHLRDPFLALQRVTSHVLESVIVTDVVWGLRGTVLSLAERLTGVRLVRFVPNASRREPLETWWNLSPGVVAEYLGILGFPHTRTTRHRQVFKGREIQLYTVVGRRSATG